MTTYKNKYLLMILIIFILSTSTVLATTQSVNYKKLVGSNRYDTSVKVAKEAYPEGAANVILTLGTSNVDGIITAPLAQKLSAPVLMVEKNKLPTGIKSEITDLKAKKAYLIGGTDVISNNVINELKTMGITSKRIYGGTRYTTAIAIAEEIGNFNSIIVCNSRDGGKNVAAIANLAAQKNIPILYNDSNTMNADTYTFIKNNLVKGNCLYVVGNKLSSAQKKELENRGINIVPISSQTPYEINVELINKLGIKANNITLVNNAVDAVSINYLAAKNNSILLYTDTSLSASQKNIIKNNNISSIYYTGGGKIKGSVKEATYIIENKRIKTDTTIEFDKDKVVFYIPHQDDEASYISQTILRAIKAKGAENVYIVMITDGAGSAVLTKNGGVTIRKILYEHGFISSKDVKLPELKKGFQKARDNEFKASGKALGLPDENVIFVENLGFSRLPDGSTKAKDVKPIMKYFENLFKGNVTHVSYSFAFETHNDHQQIGQALNELYYDLSLNERSFCSVYFIIREDYRDLTANEIKTYKAFDLHSKDLDLNTRLKIKDALNVYKGNCKKHIEDYNAKDHRVGIGYMSAPTVIDRIISYACPVNEALTPTLVSTLHLPN